MNRKTSVTAGSSSQPPKDHGRFGAALRKVSDVLTIPVCPDLIAYRSCLKPILDEVIAGEQVVKSVVVDRKDIFHFAIALYKSREKKHVQLIVKFETDGVREDGYDGGGLRREFYSTFFKSCLKEANMFVGSGRRKMPSNDMSMVQNGFFEALGMAIVDSILNGDCGFPYLAPAVFYYLIDEDLTEHLSLDDVPDLDMKDLGERLNAAKTDSDVEDIAADAPVIDHIGWPPGQSFNLKTRDALVEQLVRWSMIDKRKVSLDKLKQGLNHLGFLEATKKNPMLLPLLVYSSQYSVTADYMKTKVLPQVKKLDCKDDTQRSSKKFMEEFLENISDEEAQSLFQFVTGTADPPVDEETISVDFNNLKKTQKLPEAHTCSLRLLIPQGNSNSAEFSKSLKYAIANAKQGFGNLAESVN